MQKCEPNLWMWRDSGGVRAMHVLAGNDVKYYFYSIKQAGMASTWLPCCSREAFGSRDVYGTEK